MVRDRLELVATTGGTHERRASAATIARRTTFVRQFFLHAMLVSSVMAFAAARASAGSVTCTWVEDDGQSVTGHLTVATPLTVAGEITLPADATSFAFSVPGASYVISGLQNSTTPVNSMFEPIGPPGTSLAAIGNASINMAAILAVYMDAYESQQASEHIYWSLTSEPVHVGHGHWHIVQSLVPEPSSAALASIALTAGITYQWRRSRLCAATAGASTTARRARVSGR